MSFSKRRRTGWILGAVVLVLVVVVGLAGALVLGNRGGGDNKDASGCSDVEFIGAAGSGQRTVDTLTDTPVHSGVGEIVETTYLNLVQDLPENRTIALHPVEYPALPVPGGMDRAAWTDFLGSVSTGADTAEALIRDALVTCEDATIVVAGYSQGAMAVHRALQRIGPDPRIVAGVFIGDGDKVADDNVTTLPGEDTDSRAGIAQVASGLGISTGAVVEKLPETWRPVLISACLDGDVVCAPTSFNLNGFGTHGDYDAEAWRAGLLDRVTG
ncbi:cutinase family protein [Corynebacterium neomassiliense]|uniref:cutinase family protein n=1 Tax=Corynebacterium neomassiliense TaxID=2079482 RepID=UPI0013871D08|nr:cutinase family protein [Corynebacterium neomassiliense]